MRSSWQEWVIGIALVAITCGGAWLLWGDVVLGALDPSADPPAETAAEPPPS